MKNINTTLQNITLSTLDRLESAIQYNQLDDALKLVKIIEGVALLSGIQSTIKKNIKIKK